MSLWDELEPDLSDLDEYGADYHDLATFYWDIGDKQKALELAREGMAIGAIRGE